MSQVQVQEQKIHILPPLPTFTDTVGEYKITIEGKRLLIIYSDSFRIYSELNLWLTRSRGNEEEKLYHAEAHNGFYFNPREFSERVVSDIIEMEKEMFDSMIQLATKIKEVIKFALANNIEITLDDP